MQTLGWERDLPRRRIRRRPLAALHLITTNETDRRLNEASYVISHPHYAAYLLGGSQRSHARSKPKETLQTMVMKMGRPRIQKRKKERTKKPRKRRTKTLPTSKRVPKVVGSLSFVRLNHQSPSLLSKDTSKSRGKRAVPFMP